MPDWIAQIEALLRYHLPSGEAVVPWWSAAMAIVVGVILCLAGARLVRAAFVLGFAGAGAALGAQAAAGFDFSAIAGIVLGVILGGLVGYVFFRLWVAMFGGLVAAAIAACVAVGPNMPALLQEFDDARIAGGATGDGFALLTPEQQQAAQRAGLAEYGREFVQHVWSRYPGDARRAAVVLAAAFLVGAAIGLLAHRWAIVLGTAALGTMLILAGALPLINRYCPQVVEHCEEHPIDAMIGLGIWAIVAIAVQRRGLHAVTTAALPPPPPQPDH
jgi:MFS family permease